MREAKCDRPSSTHYVLGGPWRAAHLFCSATVRMRHVILLFLGLLAVSAIRADEAAARAVAERIVDLVGGVEVAQGVQIAMFDRMEKEAVSRGMPPAGAAELRKAMQDWFRDHFGKAQMRSFAADIYVQEFTEEELKQMLVFYETPVGRKALRKTMAMRETITAKSAKLMTENRDSLTAIIAPIVEKYGMTNKPSISGPANRSKPSRSETNRTSSPAGSRP